MARFCTQCGAALEDTQVFCTYCGAQNDCAPQNAAPTYPQQQYTQPQQQYNQAQYYNQQAPTYSPNQYGQPDPYGAYQGYQQSPVSTYPQANDMPMKWYKFIIYFQLFANCVGNVLMGIMALTGAQYTTAGGNPDLVYRFFPDLQSVDMIYGILLIGIAVFAIITRMQLANFRQNGPMFYYIFMGASIVASLFYLFAAQGAISSARYGSYVNLDFTQYASSAVSSIVVLVLNVVYFNKRKHLFNK